jgi:hypothetical protein
MHPAIAAIRRNRFAARMSRCFRRAQVLIVTSPRRT